ncbi:MULTISPECIES: serine hydrolase [unclassified Mycolicibacterium]|uniref:serine hydrolase domain-containing protein n=1 Tax=unclassified Mycolicibacterium TaxID=2636767 RepID=UPI0012DC9BE6|nr:MULTISPECIES: serine hydrolase [unclassified Mycolicibacterium]MUL82262.1 serine hydrolase [Mycolicibacterium sp. CBMA 329]MUL88028.1 serine hydrolase [Mycolicibacterium sp. CBMA 331]MUM02359.1 serine hydrolase [Mycolicibacterium sp. CBMA 334]MUM29117.1 serine hydrolase [Mycolicibacterium sp. CBMA 295]MUM38325.1 serine hydrolase [Mycolicibacterium sp. CBMA 247]
MADDSPSSMLELGLFTGTAQHENFCRMPDLVSTGSMAPSSAPYEWPTTDAIPLPDTYQFDGQAKSTHDFLTETDTVALLVVDDGAICHEWYGLTGGPDVPWISMSVAKSVISALVGIAVEEGHIASIEKPISDYIRVAPGSAYDGVSIKNVLQMSSGARWSEDYNDPGSDIFRLAAAMGAGGSLEEFVATMVRDIEPGRVCRYNSGDTQALGTLLVNTTNRSITDYMREKLVQPLGISSPAYWLLDSAGMEVVFAGLVMTARDYAKFGELYRNGGRWRGKQVVPEPWVNASLNADADHLQPGQPVVGNHSVDLGYGYQWWLPARSSGEFSAIGVYNQFIYVDPAKNTVVVKLSANRAYGTSDEECTNREQETIEFLRAINATASGR